MAGVVVAWPRKFLCMQQRCLQQHVPCPNRVCTYGVILAKFAPGVFPQCIQHISVQNIGRNTETWTIVLSCTRIWSRAKGTGYQTYRQSRPIILLTQSAEVMGQSLRWLAFNQSVTIACARASPKSSPHLAKCQATMSTKIRVNNLGNCIQQSSHISVPQH